MKIEIKIHRDYKRKRIALVDIISTKVKDNSDWWFKTQHLPSQPIGEAVEAHLKTMKLRLKINGMK